MMAESLPSIEPAVVFGTMSRLWTSVCLSICLFDRRIL
jgi:hypothetical protein